MSDGPDFYEWQPPHLAQPLRIPTKVAPKKPASTLRLSIAGGLVAFGVGFEAAGTLALRSSVSSVDDQFIFLFVGSQTVAPLFIVAGAVILALAKSKKAWLATALATVVIALVSAFTMHVIGNHHAEASCREDRAISCLARAKSSWTKAERIPFERHACEIGAHDGCVTWGQDEPNASPGANEAMQAFCASRPNEYPCTLHVDYTTVCTNPPGGVHDYACH